jgi:hypothetical protein
MQCPRLHSRLSAEFAGLENVAERFEAAIQEINS